MEQHYSTLFNIIQELKRWLSTRRWERDGCTVTSLLFSSYSTIALPRPPRWMRTGGRKLTAATGPAIIHRKPSSRGWYWEGQRKEFQHAEKERLSKLQENMEKNIYDDIDPSSCGTSVDGHWGSRRWRVNIIWNSAILNQFLILVNFSFRIGAFSKKNSNYFLVIFSPIPLIVYLKVRVWTLYSIKHKLFIVCEK